MMKDTDNSADSPRSARKRATPRSATATAADLNADAEAVVESVNVTARHVGELVREHTTHRPYMSLGVAAGVGFVLGGGLSPKMTTTLLGWGGRMLVNQLLKEVSETR